MCDLKKIGLLDSLRIPSDRYFIFNSCILNMSTAIGMQGSMPDSHKDGRCAVLDDEGENCSTKVVLTVA